MMHLGCLSAFPIFPGGAIRGRPLTLAMRKVRTKAGGILVLATQDVDLTVGRGSCERQELPT